MYECNQYEKFSRRSFLSKSTLGLGALTLGSMINPTDLFASPSDKSNGILGAPHFAPKAKRVIYLFMSGGPSQIETFDYKPELEKRYKQELPDSVRGNQRLTGMSSGQKSFPLAKSFVDFKQHGESGTWVSDFLPFTSQIVDELCVIKSMYTDAINHDPAITFIQTGSQQPGRPSIGSWLSYGLGSENRNLPGFVVLQTAGKQGQPLYARLWGNGFLPSEHQGIQFRAGKDPVLYLSNPEGIDMKDRGRQLEYMKQLQEMQKMKTGGDPEIDAKIAQYEMAYRMQTSVPEVMDLSDEPDYIFDLYGEDAKKPGTFAANALLARRLIEKDVRFVQLYHQGWDAHGGLPHNHRRQCRETDQASAALVMDLKQRGLLEDTLVIWGGEFGRTSYSQGKLEEDNFGRDHHPRCYSIWMAGAGVKKGMVYGETDDFSYNIVDKPMHVHDFQATLMHLLGIDHEKLTYKYQGRRFRLTDIHGHVNHDILA